ncbi:hypothetical protein HDU91_001316, partial [Kappamyces sp. JEL0680]
DENALVHTLHPQDLVPFSRKPMFVIVDSNNSTAFNNFTKVFNQPFACFMSPVEYPSSIKDITQIGNLFTLFLHCPIKALAFISDITQLNQSMWSTAISHLDGIEKHISELMDADQALGRTTLLTTDKSYKRFIQDDFLRQFCVRFVLTSVLLSAHTAFKEAKNHPVANPPMPPALLTNPELVSKIEELVKLLNVGALYAFEPQPGA